MLVRDASQYYPCRTANDFLRALNAQYAEAAGKLKIEFGRLQEVYSGSGYDLITIKNDKRVIFLEDPVIPTGTDGRQDIDLSALPRRSRLIADDRDYAIIGPDTVPVLIGGGYTRREGQSTLVIYDRNGQRESQSTFPNGLAEAKKYDLARIGEVRDYLLENFPGYFDPRMLVTERTEPKTPF